MPVRRTRISRAGSALRGTLLTHITKLSEIPGISLLSISNPHGGCETSYYFIGTSLYPMALSVSLNKSSSITWTCLLCTCYSWSTYPSVSISYLLPLSFPCPYTPPVRLLVCQIKSEPCMLSFCITLRRPCMVVFSHKVLVFCSHNPPCVGRVRREHVLTTDTPILRGQGLFFPPLGGFACFDPVCLQVCLF